MLYFNKFLPHLWSHLFQILSVQKSEFLSRAVGVTESQTSMKCQETGSCWTSSSNLPHYKCIVSHRPPKIWAFVPEFQPWMMLNYPFLPLFCKMGWTQSLLFFCWVSRSARSSPLDAEFSSFFYFLFSRMSWQESFQTFCWTRVAVITNLPCCHVMSQCEKTANVVSRCMDTVFCVTFYISNVFEHTTTLNSNVRPFFFHIHLALAVCQLMYIYPAF